jgi:poly(3-hydroxybutyrate) depolymerase
MKASGNAAGKLILLLCLITLQACQFRPQRNQEPPVSPTTEPVTTSPTVLATTTLAPTTTETVAVPLNFVTGRNDYVITVDDTRREFIVYVPGGYDPGRPTPIVIMFHGSNQSGNAMYEKTNWAARAEQENFIVVFPTSWKYLLTSSNRVEDKWNDMVMEATEPGVEFKDDVHFTKMILEQLNATFNVDKKRVFASGFSNGAWFVVSRLIPQMANEFAAFATAGKGPSSAQGVDSVETIDAVDASLYMLFGTMDMLNAELMGLSVPFPFEAEEIANDPNFSPMLVNATTHLDLNMTYTVQSNPNFTKLTFDQSLVGADNEFIFQMVRGMNHVYPDGNNNLARLDATVVFWDFFMQHSNP